MTSIALAAGGTAGHIEPALATARAILKQKVDAKIYLIGTPKGLESKLVPSAGFHLELVNASALPRKISMQLFLFPFNLFISRAQAIKILKSNKTALVIGFGAYVSFPVYLAAKKLKIPIIIHEGNAKPGIANRFFYKKAKYVFQCFENSLPGAETIGMPLRESISSISLTDARIEGCQLFGLDPKKQTLLVFGGSQGALKINKALTEVIGLLTAAGFQVLHAVGPNKQIEKTLDIFPDYHPVSYIDRMDLAYAVADLVVSRSGAMTVSEVTALGKVAIFVPFPSGNGEQSENIRELIANGAAVTISDAELTGEKLLGTILDLFKSDEKLSQLSKAATNFGRRDADQILARKALTLLSK
jgi:UDP-N-acetylglucosamine--N-acetylmuramyl-(pentapeptide) pyrophosphoryl-undecaprenol N-acetylglucosamine transferase